MKKYLQRVLVILLIASLIGNVYLFIQFTGFKKNQQQDYRINVNHFYGHFWQMEYRLDNILDEKDKTEPDIVSIASNVSSLKKEVWQADEKLANMEKYSTADPKLEVYRIPSLLFGMYFGYRINRLETSLSDRNVEELLVVAEEIHNEYSIARDILPTLDTEFLELTEEEQIAIWVEIVNQLPESEELDNFKDFINFEWLVKEKYQLNMN